MPYNLCSSLQTIRFKSYLLSMGIANPVTRETHGSGTHYHLQLAKQLGTMLQAPLEVSLRLCTICVSKIIRWIQPCSWWHCTASPFSFRSAGVWWRSRRFTVSSTVPEGWRWCSHSCLCPFMPTWPLSFVYFYSPLSQLLSPEDLVNACKMFESLKLPLRFVPFHVSECIWSELSCRLLKTYRGGCMPASESRLFLSDFLLLEVVSSPLILISCHFLGFEKKHCSVSLPPWSSYPLIDC